MNTLISLFILLTLSACRDTSVHMSDRGDPSFKKWTVNLKHTNTQLTLNLPNAYDTMFAWKETACQCISNKYRIQSKLFPIYFDGCCIDTLKPFNKLQLTIQEPLYPIEAGKNVEKEEIIKEHREVISEFKKDPLVTENLYDTIVIFRNQIFPIISSLIQDYKHSSSREILQTTIYLEGLPTRLIFEKSYKSVEPNRTIFIKDCIKSIKTITTSNGP
jgi:hypothetical protein